VSLRVVAGSARGLRLDAPPGAATRPTTDRVREATFNALASLGALEAADVLDLFAGSGALGIEALSRGARAATFVERDEAARAAIRTNLERTGLQDRATVLAVAAERAVADAAAREHTYDLVLLDPPYAFDGWDDLLRGLAAVVAGGLVVAESDHEVTTLPGWVAVRQRRYGTTVVGIFRPPETHPS
jgi:16S rRNA (guanine966-N2)-methyltransferase